MAARFCLPRRRLTAARIIGYTFRSVLASANSRRAKA